ncbi:vacuolar protein sorting-associated protein 13B isoform A [Alligator mississippiensis]|uniref:Vacuolar protein sorting-associated protein 13B isoform A n=1 Tax=Alligator mississippiensis TaxID=8496 RepID=A0A151MXU4_ALLMI|nr:vacuolar protein sorting-associated protein 13B isoform A [Alligator mississippiensis]
MTFISGRQTHVTMAFKKPTGQRAWPRSGSARMLESYVTPILMSYVNRYIKNLKPSDLQLSLWGGDVVLSKLELKLDVLEQELKLPFTFLSGHIHELRIHVPWTKLGSEPVVITINTMECILKLKDGAQEDHESCGSSSNRSTTESAKSTVKPRRIQQASPSDPDLPPGYVQSLIRRVVNNVNIVINNLILKYVEDDIVLSVNITSAECYTVDEFWDRAFMDISATDLVLRKVINFSDCTVCLDKRNASGKIEFYQDPLLYKCSFKTRLHFTYDNLNSKMPSVIKIHTLVESLKLSITDQQLPMFIRIMQLGIALYYGEIGSFKDGENEDLVCHTKDILGNISGAEDETGSTLQYPTQYINQEPYMHNQDDEQQQGWFSWAWSLVPAIVSYDGEDGSFGMDDGTTLHQQKFQALKDPIVSVGFYCTKATVTFKLTEMQAESSYYSPQKVKSKEVIRWEQEGTTVEVLMMGEPFFDCQIGFVGCQALCLKGIMGIKDFEENINRSDAEAYFFTCGENLSTKGMTYLTNSLFDYRSPENNGIRAEFILDAAHHKETYTEIAGMQRFGAFYMDYLYTMESTSGKVPGNQQDLSSVKSEDFGNVQEMSTKTLIVGPLNLRLDSSAVHRIMKMVVCALEHEYEPYGKAKSDIIDGNRTMPDSEVASLEEYIPTRLTSFTILKCTITIPMAEFNLLDHLLPIIMGQKNSSGLLNITSFQPVRPLPSIRILVDKINLEHSVPMYAEQLVQTVSSLSQPSDNLLHYCNAHCYLKIFGFQAGLTSLDIRGSYCSPAPVIPSFSTAFYGKLLKYPRSWTKRSHVPLTECIFELPNLTIQATRAQTLLLQTIYQSWFHHLGNVSSTAVNETLLNEVFQTLGVKSKNPLPTLEGSIQNVELKYCSTSLVKCASGTVGSIKICAKASGDGGKEKLIPLIQGPSDTRDLHSSKWLNESRKPESLLAPDLVAFTIQIPRCMDYCHNSGAVLLTSVQGLAVNIDPVLYTWLTYQPQKRNSRHIQQQPVGTVPLGLPVTRKKEDEVSVGSAPLAKQQSNQASEYASSPVKTKTVTESRPLSLPVKAMQNSTESCKSPEERMKEFIGIVWDAVKCLTLQLEVQSCCVFIPNDSLHSPSTIVSGDIPGTVRSWYHGQASMPGTLVVCLPRIKIMSAGHKYMEPLQEIPFVVLRPILEEGDAFPWTISLHHFSVYTVLGQQMTLNLVEPMGCTSTLAVTSQKLVASGSEYRHSFVVCLHVDLESLEIKCSNPQVQLLYELADIMGKVWNKIQKRGILYQSSIYVESVAGPAPPSSPVKSSVGTAPPDISTYSPSADIGTTTEGDSVPGGDDSPFSDSVTLEQTTSNIGISSGRVSLWMQWMLPKITIKLFAPDPGNTGTEICVVSELEDLSASVDMQDVYTKVKCKIESFNIDHYRNSLGEDCWSLGQYGGVFLSCTDKLNRRTLLVRPVSKQDPFSNFSGFFPSTTSKLLDGSHQQHGFLSLTYTKAVTKNVRHKLISRNERRTFHKLSEGVIRVFFPKTEGIQHTGAVANQAIKEDTLVLKIGSVSMAPQADNPLSRAVLRKDIYQRALNLGILRDPGSEVEDRQYQIDLQSINIGTAQWHQLKPEKENSKGGVLTENERNSQNPALEWNMASSIKRHQERRAILTPILTDFTVRITAAPAIIFTKVIAPENLHTEEILVCGHSLEVNVTTNLDFFLSVAQVQLLQQIIQANMVGLETSSKAIEVSKQEQKKMDMSDGGTVETSSRYSGAQDSGIGSDSVKIRIVQIEQHSGTSQHRIARPSRQSSIVKNLNFIPFDIFITASRISVMTYLCTALLKPKSTQDQKDGDQPSILLSCHHRKQRVEISVFDAALKGVASDYKYTDPGKTLPEALDYCKVWLQTVAGEMDAKSGIPPPFITVQIKDFLNGPADINVDVSKPLKANLSFVKFDQINTFLEKIMNPNDNETSKEASASTDAIPRKDETSACSFSCIKDPLPVVHADEGQKFSVQEKLRGSLCIKAGHKTPGVIHGSSFVLDIDNFLLKTSLKERSRTLIGPFSCLANVEAKWCKHSGNPGPEHTIPKFHVDLRGGLIQVFWGQEHLNCLVLLHELLQGYLTKEGRMETLTSCQTYQTYSPTERNQVSKTEHTSDDLRTGLFQYIQDEEAQKLPGAYEVVFYNETEDSPGMMLWRYPEPRVLTLVRINPVPFNTTEDPDISTADLGDVLQIPCSLEYWDDLQKSFVAFREFSLSESKVCELQLPSINLVNDQKELVASDLWRIILNSSQNTADDQSSESESGSQSACDQLVTPTALAACTRVDSCFTPWFVPSLSVLIQFAHLELHLCHHLDQLGTAPPQFLQPFISDKNVPSELEYMIISFREPHAYLRQWSDASVFQEIQFSTQGDCKLLECRNVTLQSVVKPFKIWGQIAISSRTPEKLLDCLVMVDPIFINFGQYAVHSLSTALQAWQQNQCPEAEELVFSHIVICNDTQETLRFGQVDTDENILLASLHSHQYSWRSHKSPQLLHICIEGWGNWRWSEPFCVDNAGTFIRTIQYKGRTASLIIKVQQLSGVQKQIIICGRQIVCSYLSESIELKMVQHYIGQDGQAVVKEHIDCLAAKQKLPSYILENSELTELSVKAKGDEDWSRDVCLGSKQTEHSIVIQVPSSNSSIIHVWCTILTLEPNSQVQQRIIVFSPLFIMKSHLPDPIIIHLEKRSLGLSETQIIPGKGQEKSLQNIEPDLTHHLTFQAREEDDPSECAVPISTTLIKQIATKSHPGGNVNQILAEFYGADSTAQLAWPYNRKDSDSNEQLTQWDSPMRVKLSMWKPCVKTLLIELLPWALLINQSKWDLWLFEGEKIVLQIPAGKIIIPPNFQEAFQIGIYWASTNTVHKSVAIKLVHNMTSPKWKDTENGEVVTMDEEGFVEAEIKLGAFPSHQKLCEFCISSLVQHSIQILQIEDKTTIINNTSYQFYYRPQISVSRPQSGEEYIHIPDTSAFNIYPAGEPPNEKLSSVSCWDFMSDISQSTSEVSSIQKHILLSFSPGVCADNSQCWSLPAVIRQDIPRQCVAVPIGSCNESGFCTRAIALTYQEHLGVTYLTLTEDSSPRIIIHNRCSVPLLMKENIKDTPKFEVYCRKIPAECSVHHELYHQVSNYPDCKNKDLLPSVLLKVISPDELMTEWSDVIDINNQGTQILFLTGFGYVYVDITHHCGTIIITLAPEGKAGPVQISLNRMQEQTIMFKIFISQSSLAVLDDITNHKTSSSDHTPLSFSVFERGPIFTTARQLIHALAMHYAAGALFRAGWVVGSLEILGSPASLVRSIGNGIADFFRLPYEGLTRGPGAFVSGVSRGTTSFVKHISKGTLTSITNLATSLARNMDRLSLDEEHYNRQEEWRRQLPENLGEGLRQGLSRLGISLLGAIAGIVDQPMQNFQKISEAQASAGHKAKGVISGVGKGIMGVFTKPIGGAAELVSQTGYGILHGAGLSQLPKQRYHPSDQHVEQAPNSHVKYVWKMLQSLGRPEVHMALDVVIVSGSGQEHEGCLLLTSEVLFVVSVSEDTQQQAFPVTEIECVEDSQQENLLKVQLKQQRVPCDSEADGVRERLSEQQYNRLVEYVTKTSYHVAPSTSSVQISPVAAAEPLPSTTKTYQYVVDPSFAQVFISKFTMVKNKALRKGFN